MRDSNGNLRSSTKSLEFHSMPVYSIYVRTANRQASVPRIATGCYQPALACEPVTVDSTTACV